MKPLKLIITLASILVIAFLIVDQVSRRQATQLSEVSSGSSFEASEGTIENPLARREYEWLRLHDPATGRIPEDIAHEELEFVRNLAQQTGAYSVTVSDEWISRGPDNIGGRSKALAIDVTNENILLAGSTSSGMFKSTDGGRSWKKTTAPNQLHSVTSVAQNRAPGRQHIWYYGTGDRSAGGIVNSAIGLLGTNSFYRGDGIFKSVDGGETWTQLASTASGTPEQTDPFDFVWDVATYGEDGVLAATASGLYQSTDGGASWVLSLGFGEGEDYPSTEVALTRNGPWYATIGGSGPDNGVYRSVDNGESWENISPDDWSESTERTVMAIAPSNEDLIYFFTQVAHLEQQLWKYEDGSGWTDLTSGLPLQAKLQTYDGVLMVIDVKPDDENTIFLGAINLFRSMNGGNSFEVISGTGPNFHVDQVAIAFYPSSPGRMIVGNDGGLFRTDDNVAETVNMNLEWESLNNGYLTTQFYTVAIDHGTPGNETLLGGTQDHGVVYTLSADPADAWEPPFGGDGGSAAIVDGGENFYYAMAATLGLYRHSFIEGGGYQRTEITPTGALLGLWLTKFQLDLHDQRVMYLPSQTTLWRNSDLTAIPYDPNAGPTDVNWETLDNVKDHYIHALGMSKAEPRRLYFAGADVSAEADERVFYLDNPHQDQPVPVDITGENFPFYPYVPIVNCIAVDPRDTNRVLVIFPSYGVISIYATEDGGQNWIPVAGNLEENPDGSGSGPSVRWVSILYVEERPVYLAGTSVGLFSASELDGMNTRWIPEAQTSIGNVPVDMVDARQSDGFVAVATHGNGVYSTYITQVPTATTDSGSLPEGFAITSVYPNPLRPDARGTTVRYRLPTAGAVTASVFDVQGRKIETLFSVRLQAGTQELQWRPANVTSGVYFLRLQYENTSLVEKIVVRR